MMSRTVSVRLSPELIMWLAKRSAETGMSRSAIIRHHLEMARTGQTEGRLGTLFGAVSELPSDLSSRKSFSRN